MGKMIEDVFEYGLCASAGVTGNDAFLKHFESSVKFEISNVSDYYFSGTPQEKWNVEHDFPKPMAPFPSLWAEYRRPDKIVSEEHGCLSRDQLTNMAYRVGVLAITGDLHPQTRDSVKKSMDYFAKCLGRMHTTEIMTELNGKRELVQSLIYSELESFDIGKPPWSDFSPGARHFIATLS